MFLEVHEGDKVRPENEDVGERPPSTPIRVDAPEFPIFGLSHILAAFATLGSTSSSRTITIEARQGCSKPNGISVPDQLGWDKYSFFKGLHPL